MITKAQALTANEFHADNMFNRDGSCQRWRRNGRTRTWKRSPDRFAVPVKYGLYGYGCITDGTAHNFHTAEDCATNY